MSLTKERRCSRICPRRMRHRRCRIARFNCDGLNLMRLPRCMLWPSVSLSSLPVARLSLGDWTCVSVPSVLHVRLSTTTVYATVGGASAEPLQHGSQVGSPVRVVRRMSRKSCLVTVEGQKGGQIRGLEPSTVGVSCGRAPGRRDEPPAKKVTCVIIYIARPSNPDGPFH